MRIKNFKLITSIFLMIVFLVNGFPLKLLADELNRPECYSYISGIDFEVVTHVNSTWDQHANVEFIFTNTGSEVIHNWHFTFSTLYSIDDIWEASIVDADGSGTYTIKHNSYNQDIPVNGSVTVGVILSGTNNDSALIMPECFFLNTKISEINDSNYEVSYNIQNSWENGFSGSISLMPSVALYDWSLSFESNRTVSFVNAGILSYAEGRYVVSNDGINQNISSGVTYNINYQANGSFQNFSLSDIRLSIVDLAFPLSQDSNHNDISDYLEFIYGINPDFPDSTPTNNPELTISPVPTVSDAPTPTISAEIDWETDSDEDGLPDDFEVLLGTDIDNPDSDSDGLSDYVEIIIGYNPLSNDTDNDGVLDGNEDVDSDGLSNVYELQIGTDISSYDTDGDNLSDGDEVTIYGTNPLKYDTDDDGISDGEEILIGKNPLDDSDADVKILQTTSDIINNTEDPAITSVDIIMATEGYLGYAAYTEDLYNVDVYSTGVLGRIGSPIGLNSYVDFDEATVVIHYDENQLGDTEENNLGILWYNEETGLYVLQNQAVVDTENNTITIRLTHFSTYLMIDKFIWREPPIIDYEIPSIDDDSNGVDIIIAIENNCMFTDEERERAIDEAVAIINNAYENDRIGVIIYETNNGSSTLYTYNNRLFSTTTERNQLKVYIRANMRTLEYTNYDDVDAYVNTIIRSAILIDNNNQDIGNVRRIVHITNGRGMNYNYFYGSAYVERESNIPYFAINISDDEVSSNDWLFQRCDSTGGHYYSHRVSYDITQVLLNSLHNNIGANGYDSDEDGLPDYLEIQGMYTTNFGIVCTNPNKKDTDDDELTDYEEMVGIIYEISRTSGGVIEIRVDDVIIATYSYYIPEFSDYYCLHAYIPISGKCNYIYAANSNPTNPDTDGDGVFDIDDGIPFSQNKSVVYIFYSSIDDEFLESEAQNRRKDYLCDVIVYPISSRLEFIEKWNGMGNDKDGRAVYSIFEVVTIFHGGIDFFTIESGNSNQRITRTDVLDGTLEDKKIERLLLSSCHNGEIGKNNLAIAFASRSSINEVYAWDGKAIFGTTENTVFKLMQIHIDDRIITIALNLRLSFEFSGEFVDSYIRNALNSNLIYGLALTIPEELPLGLVKYYKSESGTIEYENIPNFSCHLDICVLD